MAARPPPEERPDPPSGGVLDPLFNAVADLIGGIGNIIEAVTNPDLDGQQASEVLGQTIEELDASGEVAGTLIDTSEEFILSDLQDAGALDPENVEALADQTEGNAMAVLLGIAGSSTALEAASLGQLDTQAEFLTQALAGLGVDDVTGMELEARVAEGIMPALNTRAKKDHTPRFVELPDAVEYALRNKQTDEGWLQGSTAPADTVDKIGSNVPVNEENLVEEWGVREDQLEILERVSLEAVEIEELIESPIQFGVIPQPEEYETVLQISGLPEEAKNLFRRTIESSKRAADLWEQRTTTGDLVGELDTFVLDEELSPTEAAGFLPAEASNAEDALLDRWGLFESLPAGTPSGTDIEDSFLLGYTDRDTFRERMDRLEWDVQRYDDVIQTIIYGELDGDLQEALALGLISENRFSNLAQEAGIDQEATDLLMQGLSFADITKRRLQEQTDPAERSVTAVQGIGEARATSLETIGVETIEDLAGADVDEVAEIVGVAPEVADRWITIAEQATE